MAFDNTDPADLLALKNEVNLDPIGMGYDPTGPTPQILSLLNDPANNVGGDTAVRTFDAHAMLDALDPGDFDAQQYVPDASVYCQMLINAETLAGIDISAYKDKFRASFAGIPGSLTVTALDAQNVALSRAEVLFGQGTEITRDDWIAARDS